MDSSYKQTSTWMNMRGTNGGSNNWVGSLPGPGPERSSLSFAGWSPYENTSRRPIISNDMPPGPQRSAGTRWSQEQSEWNETRGGGGPQAGLNLWSGPSNGNPRVMQNQAQQQKQPVQMQNNVYEPTKGHADGFIHGLNNAGRDWFYRYMDMGCSPEEARDRVLERNRNHPESLDSTPHGGGRYDDAMERRNLANERYADAKEQRNPAPDERRRPTESQRSQTLGNVLNSLNGACRKWYNRHLENGFTPEEAIAKVLEHRMTYSGNGNGNGNRPVKPSTDTDGRKRPVDSNSTVRDEPKKPKKGIESSPPQAATVSSRKNHLAVEVVAANYPKHCLKKAELTAVENALLEEMKNGWTRSLNFGGIKYRTGMIVVTCLDEGSKEWLEHVVPKITAVKGVTLRIYQEDETPDSKAINFFVPRFFDEPDDVTLRFIKEQNTDLLPGNWSIMRNRTSKPRNGKVMTLKIGDKSFDLLKKQGMTLSYRFSQLPCHIARGVPVFPWSQQKKKKATDETIVNTPEIDLTADDEDIEFSDMTVLDEVECDDDENEGGGEFAEEDANGNGEEYEQHEADEQ